MANKTTKKSASASKKPAAKSTTRVTRITAKDSGSTKSTAKTPKPKSTKAPKVATIPKTQKASKPNKTQKAIKAGAAEAKQSRNPLAALGRYFKGSWYELNQVRWPDRATTWQMTGALLAFTAFFVLLIVALDALFKYLFEFILG